MRRKPLDGKTLGMLAITLVLFITVGVAEEERTDASGQWKYTLEGGGAVITGYVEKPAGDLVIPRELDGHPVTAIDEWATDDVYLTSVTLPEGVTRIGARAFSYYFTGFSSVTIPDSMASIGNWAFYCCELTSVTIPAGVVEIAGNANYAIPEGTLRIGDGAFRNCGLTGVIIPDSMISIGDGAFWGCTDLTSVTIPDGVTDIGYMALNMCDTLTSVIVPDSVISIGDWAFGSGGGVTLSIMRGSYAEQYAKENDIPYMFTTE